MQSPAPHSPSPVVQDSQLLEPHMNLVDQCVQGEGLVQINVELKSEGGIKKINIVDVLKPADDNLRNVEDNNLKNRRQDYLFIQCTSF